MSELLKSFSNGCTFRILFSLAFTTNDAVFNLSFHVKLQDVSVDDEHNKVNVVFTPTIPHCSMATLIGLSIRVKLLRSLPPRFKVCIFWSESIVSLG